MAKGLSLSLKTWIERNQRGSEIKILLKWMAVKFRLAILYLFVDFSNSKRFMKFYVGAQKKLYKNPFTLFFSSKLFFSWTREPIFDACFTDLFLKTLIMELSYMVLKYFVLISNNDTMNPTFFSGPNTPRHM